MEKQKLPNSTAVLVLGISSILTSCCCTFPGVILGIIGLVLAKSATNKYLENSEQYTGFENVKVGKILSIIGISLGVVSIVLTLYQIQAAGGLETYIQSIKDIIDNGQGY